MAAPATQDVTSLHQSLLRLLECPVCYATCRPPIYACANGHSACNKCRVRLARCPACRAPGKPRCRNLLAENMCIEAKLPISTPHKTSSTMQEIGFNENTELDLRLRCQVHVKPTDDEPCRYIGNQKELIIHVREIHPTYLSDTSVKCTLGMSDRNYNHRTLVSVNGEIFWIMVLYTKTKARTHVWAWCVAVRDTVDKYECGFQLGSSDGRVQYSCVGQTICLGEKRVASSMPMMDIDNGLVKKLFAGNVLMLTARVVKKSEVEFI